MSFFIIIKKLNAYFESIFQELLSDELEQEEGIDIKKIDQIPIKNDSSYLKPFWIENISLSNFMHVEYTHIDKINTVITL